MILWLLIACLLMLATVFLIYPFVRGDQIQKGEALDANLQIFIDQQSQLESQL
ncbi:MAG: c-type cytochrome biogenesis protein CcmI, partial [Puniceicoccaceae bacterium]|nr:c-type cytochrome biogenesis protein CcmI [Puniceicoccaceae bacterium]